MITQLITKGEEVREDKIEITRLKEINLVNLGLKHSSERLAKAYSMKL
ncbi:hypothetical protein [Aquimarina rubra]|uniref:Uncharacterized protein n=1 Tax=Aquimarina rubra TaxID=1920033 RepID=A0ABW5LDV3_9FLAO